MSVYVKFTFCAVWNILLARQQVNKSVSRVISAAGKSIITLSDGVTIAYAGLVLLQLVFSRSTIVSVQVSTSFYASTKYILWLNTS